MSCVVVGCSFSLMKLMVKRRSDAAMSDIVRAPTAAGEVDWDDAMCVRCWDE